MNNTSTEVRIPYTCNNPICEALHHQYLPAKKIIVYEISDRVIEHLQNLHHYKPIQVWIDEKNNIVIEDRQ